MDYNLQFYTSIDFRYLGNYPLQVQLVQIVTKTAKLW